MRCPKCGRIDFDYLEICPKCGQNLRENSRRLGNFISPNPELNWFAMDSQPIEDSGSGEIGTDMGDLDLNKLGAMAKDTEFQEALDQVLGD
ncbi:MAG: hypothetical protein GWP10_17790 [Nitrospiraceae bacterium]|nr:hypothetical protein [Nitrospiraceae bacterium]